MKAVTLEPCDLIVNPINSGIMLCAFENRRIFLNRVHSFPFTGTRKGNGISPGSGKRVDENTPAGRGRLGNLVCYLAVIWLFELFKQSIRLSSKEFNVLGYRLWGDSKPGIVGQPDSLVVSGKDLVALGPIAIQYPVSYAECLKEEDGILLDIPGHFSDVTIVMHLWRSLFPIVGHGELIDQLDHLTIDDSN